MSARELLAKATARPWEWQEHKNDDGSPAPRMFLEAIGRDYRHILKITWPELLKDTDAALIVAAVNEYEALLKVEETAGIVDDWHANGEHASDEANEALHAALARLDETRKGTA